MDEQKVDMFVMTNGKFFESHQVYQVRERLLQIDNSKWGWCKVFLFKTLQ